jgi:PAS domain S-box-containing protein
MGSALLNYLTHESQETFKEKFPEIKKMAPQEGEICIVQPDGSLKYVWRKGVPFKDEDGNFGGSIGFERDITIRKENEEKIKSYQNNLQLEIQGQTQELESANIKLTEILSRLTVEQEKYKSLLDALPDFIYTISKQGIILDTHIPYLNPLNFLPTDFIGKNLHEILPKDTADLTLDNVIKALKSKSARQFNYSINVRGKIRYQEVRMVYKNDAEVLTIIRDVTQSVIAEQALKDSEEMRRTIINATQEAIIAINELGLITLFNPAAEKMFLIEKNDIIGHTLDRLLPSDIKEKHQEFVISYFKTGKPDGAIGRVLELHAIRSDKKIFPIEVSLSTGLVSNKRYVVAVMRDITERKKTEALIRNSEKSYRSIFNNVSEAIYIQDEEGVFIDVNKGATSMYDYSREDFIGKTPEFLSAPDKNDLEAIGEMHKKAFNGEPQRFEFWGLRRNGKIFPKEVWLNKGWYFNKEVVIALSVDITERVEIEKILRNAKNRAEESDRLKSAFLANMSHEIRTPMNSILGFSDLLSVVDSDEERERYVEIIKFNGSHLLNIINDIIDISKIEAGLTSITESSFSLKSELEELYNTFKLRHELIENKLELQLSMPIKEKDVFIYTDQTKFRQVMINLLSNAVKFTNKGKIEFGFDWTNENEMKFFRFFVKDTGIGLSEKDQEYIFDRFRQADISETNTTGGTGLGLAISKAFIGLFGGKIWVESKKGVGSSFYFTIPHKDIKSMQKTPQIKTELSELFNWEDKTVLVVEDNIANFYLLQAYLVKTKINVLWAKDGKSAIEITRHSSPDIILMDIKLPQMDGYETTTIIKKDFPDIPIIAQTAYAMDADLQKAKEAGCDDFLPKPIYQDKLFNSMAKFMD